MGPIGLARFCSLRSWLSQWSADATQADGLAAAGRISIPALVIENEADDVCTPRYSRGMFDALASEDKTIHRVDGANHYYIGVGKGGEGARGGRGLRRVAGGAGFRLTILSSMVWSDP